MAEIGKINVKLTADDSDLNSTLKRSEASLSGFSKSAAASVAKIAASAAAASAAIAGVTVAIVKSAADSNRELINQANLANTTASELKAYSIASKTVGIEQKDLADILKDVNDRVGDFLTTGAGGMADFFEKIAPRVGVTVEQFKNLSGPQALQLYVDTLQKANISQAEMVFHLEAISSNSTALLPLLRDNGSALRELTNNAREMNVVLSEVEIQQLANATATFDTFGQIIDSTTDRLALQLAPVIDVVGKNLVQLSKDTNGFEGAIVRAVEFGVIGAGVLADGWRGLEIIFRGLNVAVNAFAVGGLSVLASTSEGIDFVVNTALDGINTIIRAANNIPGVDLEEFVTGESTSTQKLREWQELMAQSLDESISNLHEKLMEPLPSEGLKKFLEDVKAASQEAAEVASEARLKALGLDNDSMKSEQERSLTRFQMLQELENQGQDGLSEAMSMASDRRKKKAEDEKRQQIGAAKDMFRTLSSLQSSENKRLFEIGKVASIANATLSGYEAVVHSYNAGSKLGGPVVGAAFAATAGIATAAQIAQIASASFGGGGGGGSAIPSTAPSVPAQPQQQQGSNVAISIVGNENSTFSRGQVISLIEGINEAVADGSRIRIV